MNCGPSKSSSITVILNTEEVPNLTGWGDVSKKIIEDWNSNVLDLLGMLHTNGEDTVFLTLKNLEEGIAWTDGNKIEVTSFWIQKKPDDFGLIVHELVHVHQAYPQFEPGWVTEGIADYIRWGFYEEKPLTWFPINESVDGYKNSYQITGGFFLWLEQFIEEGLVKRLNLAMKTETYTDDLFESMTHIPLPDLWKQYLEFRANDREI